MNIPKKPQQLSFDKRLVQMPEETKRARNTYSRPRDNMGTLHRRHK